MEIRASKTERAYPGAARMLIGMDPRARFSVHIEWRRREVRLAVWLPYMQRWRENLFVQRKRCLYQAGDSRGALRVSDHRLDRSEGAALRRGSSLAPKLRECLHLRSIAHDRSGAMRFNQLDGGG